MEEKKRKRKRRGEKKYLGKCRVSLLPNLHVGYCDLVPSQGILCL
jgi:hypothetical protein